MIPVDLANRTRGGEGGCEFHPSVPENTNHNADFLPDPFNGVTTVLTYFVYNADIILWDVFPTELTCSEILPLKPLHSTGCNSLLEGKRVFFLFFLEGVGHMQGYLKDDWFK